MRSFGQLWPTLKRYAALWFTVAKTTGHCGGDAVGGGGGRSQRSAADKLLY